MFKAKQIAVYLLSLSDPDIGDIVSHLKLQKLLYYAQGFHLALENKRLFEEDIYVWEHGPVVVDLWHKYKHYNSDPIPKPKELNFKIFNDQQKELLDEIYSIFGQYSAWRLRDMIHEEPPWVDTPRNEIITDKKMIEYFSTQIEDVK